MKSIAFLMLLVFTLLANFSEFDNKRLKIIQKFDIEDSFLKDKNFNRLLLRTKSDTNRRYVTYLNRAYIFIPTLVKLLKDENIPLEFLYLAMAESNFLTKAKSRKKAIGLWQFMSPTGKKFGLKINQYLDERKDIIKSTKAAVSYLKYLRNFFGKWYLAAMAYNCGEGRVAKVIAQASMDKFLQDNQNNKQSYDYINAKNALAKFKKRKLSIRNLMSAIKSLDVEPTLSYLLENRISKKQYLPRETRHYIRKILTLSTLSEDFDNFFVSRNNHLLNMGATNTITNVQVSGGVALRDVANKLNMSIEDLSNLNRQFKLAITPAHLRTVDIYIPYVKLAEFKTKEKEIKSSANSLLVHLVKSGDSLYSLGRIYGVSYRVIKRFNNLRTNRLRINQKLIIPILKI